MNPSARMPFYVLAGLMLAPAVALAKPPGHWHSTDVDLRLPGGNRIKSIYYPPGRSPLHRKHPSPTGAASSATMALQAGLGAEAPETVFAGVIHSPPIGGFHHWIAIVATDARDDPLEVHAIPWGSVIGNDFVADDQTGYGIGLFDTGASALVIGHTPAEQMNLFSSGMITTNTQTISGVTGSVVANVSMPLGLFITGLQDVDLEGLLLSRSNMVGEYNVSALVGPVPEPGYPDLFTAIGSPMAVFLTAVIKNDEPISRTRGGTTYTGPTVHLYDSYSDPGVPIYPNQVSMQLRPSGANVDYFPCIEIPELGWYCPGGDENPEAPSLISDGLLGLPVQSLFFLSRVDLYDNGLSATQNSKFMFDTGAQVTVIGYTPAGYLGLNPYAPDFQEKITGVDGQETLVPGFYLDQLTIPATGYEWLTFTNVPVVLMDIESPEGGVYDGIIGMNLLREYNFVFRGGGMTGQQAPALFFQRIPPIYDADYDNDQDVDAADAGAINDCLSGAMVNATSACIAAWDADDDNDVDMDDVGIFQRCYTGSGVTPAWDCGR